MVGPGVAQIGGNLELVIGADRQANEFNIDRFANVDDHAGWNICGPRRIPVNHTVIAITAGIVNYKTSTFVEVVQSDRIGVGVKPDFWQEGGAVPGSL